MFDFEEAAVGHALTAKALLDKPDYLNDNPSVVPIFIASLYQSLEISLKYYAIGLGLVDGSHQFRDRKFLKKNNISGGHDIDGLYQYINSELRARTGLCFFSRLRRVLCEGHQGELVGLSLSSEEMAPTRKAYRIRELGYLEVKSGDIQYFGMLDEWALAVLNLALTLKDWVTTDRKEAGLETGGHIE